MSWGMSTLRKLTFCHDNAGAVRNNKKKIFCMIKREEAIMHIFKIKGRRVNSLWFVSIRSSWICIVDISYTSCNKFNFVCKDILPFRSIFSSWKLPPHSADHISILWTFVSSLGWQLAFGETLLSEYSNGMKSDLNLKIQEPILALPLSRYKPTSHFTSPAV